MVVLNPTDRLSITEIRIIRCTEIDPFGFVVIKITQRQPNSWLSRAYAQTLSTEKAVIPPITNLCDFFEPNFLATFLFLLMVKLLPDKVTGIGKNSYSLPNSENKYVLGNGSEKKAWWYP